MTLGEDACPTHSIVKELTSLVEHLIAPGVRSRSTAGAFLREGFACHRG